MLTYPRLAAVSFLLAVTLHSAGFAQHGARCDDCLSGSCCAGPTCVGKSEIVDVEKDCWEVECKDICVPAVRFPWECGGKKKSLFSLFKKHHGCGQCDDASCDGSCGGNGCCTTCLPPKCGFVRRVAKLKKDSYTCTECKYSLELVDSGCGSGCCDEIAESDVQPLVPTPAQGAHRRSNPPAPAALPAAASGSDEKSRPKLIPAAFRWFSR